MTVATPGAPAGGELTGRFADITVIRVGAQSTVYQGREPDGRIVAIKVPNEVRPTWVHDMMRAQGVLLEQLGGHRHIITLRRSLVLPDGRPALVLDRCVPLADPNRPGERMPLPQVIALGIKIAGALETVHAAGMLHCDVRPATVLCTDAGPAGEPVLAGFDEAVSTRAGASRFPQQVITAHTAPELLEGAEPIPASDVYGLAATLYELVAGHAPFRHFAGESAATIIVRVLSGQVQPIVAPDVPLDVSDLLTWALAGDPSARPPSPAWFAEELGRMESHQGWPRTRLVAG